MSEPAAENMQWIADDIWETVMDVLSRSAGSAARSCWN